MQRLVPIVPKPALSLSKSSTAERKTTPVPNVPEVPTVRAVFDAKKRLGLVCETLVAWKPLQLAVWLSPRRSKSQLGIKAMHREVEQAGGTYALRESSEAYGANLPRKIRR
jgi:hypothetical protein